MKGLLQEIDYYDIILSTIIFFGFGRLLIGLSQGLGPPPKFEFVLLILFGVGEAFDRVKSEADSSPSSLPPNNDPMMLIHLKSHSPNATKSIP